MKKNLCVIFIALFIVSCEKQTYPNCLKIIIKNETSINIKTKIFFNDFTCNCVIHSNEYTFLTNNHYYDKYDRSFEPIEIYYIGNKAEYDNYTLKILVKEIFSVQEPISLFIDSIYIYDTNDVFLYKQAPIDNSLWIYEYFRNTFVVNDELLGIKSE